MDYKAFLKISSEAEEAFREHRIWDLLELATALTDDTLEHPLATQLTQARDTYSALLSSIMRQDAAASPEPQQFICRVYTLLHLARRHWLMQHQPTPFATMAQAISQQFQLTQLLELLRPLRPDGALTPADRDYRAALDTAFGLLWSLPLEPADTGFLADGLCATNLFARRTLISALLLSLLEYYCPARMTILLQLADHTLSTAPGPATTPDPAAVSDHADLLARCAVALALLAQRYAALFDLHEQAARQLRTFFTAPTVRSLLPQLLRALTAQSLTPSVGQRIDDILPVIKSAFEKMHPLGPATDDAPSPDVPIRMEVRTLQVTDKEGRRFMEQLMGHARKVDEMRQALMDVNAANFAYMKHFPFFQLAVHWFYPFHPEIQEIQGALRRPDGKPDRLALSIMDNNRFCDSDRYSFACMQAYLREKTPNGLTQQLMEQMEQMSDQVENLLDEQELLHPEVAAESADHLPPLFNYCQVLYRFLTRPIQNISPANPFADTTAQLLPLSPLFADLFTDPAQLQPTIQSLMLMGAYEPAVVVCNHVADHIGITADLLRQRGIALMNLQQWRRALSDFQQAQLFEEDDHISLLMARCHLAEHAWDDALPLLQLEADRQDPPSPAAIEELARCLLCLHRWEEAAQQFYRLELMEKRLSVARRGIAWCALHQGKFDRAEQYYRLLMQEKKRATWEDYINLGHALWLQGRSADALDTYRQFVNRFNRTRRDNRGSFSHWTEAFRQDARDLLMPHFSQTEVALMQDAILC